MSFLYCILALASLLTSTGTSGQVIDTEEDVFRSLLGEGKVFLIDVRTAEEYAQAHIAGAANADWYQEDFLEQVKALYPENKGLPLAVYCRTGKRSSEAAAALAEAGYTVFNLLGGITGWIDSGLPVETSE